PPLIFEPHKNADQKIPGHRELVSHLRFNLSLMLLKPLRALQRRQAVSAPTLPIDLTSRPLLFCTPLSYPFDQHYPRHSHFWQRSKPVVLRVPVPDRSDGHRRIVRQPKNFVKLLGIEPFHWCCIDTEQRSGFDQKPECDIRLPRIPNLNISAVRGPSCCTFHGIFVIRERFARLTSHLRD